MMDIRALQAFERPIRDHRVLSVYLDGEAGDPGVRDQWRIRCKGALAVVEKELASAPRDERAAFDRAAAVIERAAAAAPAGGRGWVAFATEDGLRLAEPAPHSIPTLAVWQQGALIAPYLRLAALASPVLVVILDRKRARVFEQMDDHLETVATITPHTHPGPEPRARGSRLGKMHGPVRGETGADALSRVRLAEREDLVRHLAADVTQAAGKETPVIVGGTPEMVRAAMAALTPKLGARVLENPSLTHAASRAMIAAAAHAVAPRRYALAHAGLLDAIEEEAGAGGRAALSASGAIGALREGRARELLLARHWVDEHPAQADLAVKAAFDAKVPVAELAGEEGERLAALGGVAARLRFGNAPRPARSARATIP